MYEYEFVRLECKSKLGLWENRHEPDEDYTQIVREYASKGWRFVQIFAPQNWRAGIPAYYELIFERQL